MRKPYIQEHVAANLIGTQPTLIVHNAHSITGEELACEVVEAYNGIVLAARGMIKENPAGWRHYKETLRKNIATIVTTDAQLEQFS